MIIIPTQQPTLEKSSVMEGQSSTMGTLAALTALALSGPTVLRGGKLLSVRGSIRVFSATPGDGPWMTGVMNADLTAAELLAYLVLAGPLRPDDVTVREVASRGKFVRTLGVLQPQGDGSSASIYLDDRSLKGLKFSESGEGAGWDWWIVNLGAAMTTGASWGPVTQTFVQWNPSG